MGNLFSLLAVARDGIFVNQGGLDVTGQNIAGAASPGYVRRTPQIQSLPSGSVGVTAIVRNFDRFTYSHWAEQNSFLQSAQTRASALGDVEAVVSPSQDNLSDRADALIAAFHQLAVHPDDVSIRSTLLGRATSLANGISAVANTLDSFRSELYTQAHDVTNGVNALLTQLNGLDRGIVQATARGEDSSALRDRRDQTMSAIIERVGGTAVEGVDGNVTLFAMGSVLYQGGVAAQLSVQIATDGKLSISADRAGNVVDVTQGVNAGSLAGVMQARDTDVPSASAELDSFAYDLSNMINGIHEAGVGLDGVGGRPLFVPPTDIAGAAHAMQLNPDMLDHPETVAASSSAADLPGGNDIALLLAGVSQTKLAGGGTYAERYAKLANNVGLARNAADGETKTREDTVTTALALRESASGVSSDEETVRLQQFQRGFEASMKVLKTVSDLFDALMQAI